MSENACAAIVMAGVVLVIVLLMAVGFVTGARWEQSAAIKAGVGQWSVDKSTGVTKFVYGRVGD